MKILPAVVFFLICFFSFSIYFGQDTARFRISLMPEPDYAGYHH